MSSACFNVLLLHNYFELSLSSLHVVPLDPLYIIVYQKLVKIDANIVFCAVLIYLTSTLKIY